MYCQIKSHIGLCRITKSADLYSDLTFAAVPSYTVYSLVGTMLLAELKYLNPFL